MTKINRNILAKIARQAAIDSTHRYAYLVEASDESWQAHSWVINAMQTAVEYAMAEDDTKEKP